MLSMVTVAILRAKNSKWVSFLCGWLVFTIQGVNHLDVYISTTNQSIFQLFGLYALEDANIFQTVKEIEISWKTCINVRPPQAPIFDILAFVGSKLRWGGVFRKILLPWTQRTRGGEMDVYVINTLYLLKTKQSGKLRLFHCHIFYTINSEVLVKSNVSVSALDLNFN